MSVKEIRKSIKKYQKSMEHQNGRSTAEISADKAVNLRHINQLKQSFCKY